MAKEITQEEEKEIKDMIEDLIKRAKIASQEYMKLDQETVDNIKYATFETEHFSTYVLGEKAEERPREAARPVVSLKACLQAAARLSVSSGLRSLLNTLPEPVSVFTTSLSPAE